MPSTAQTSTLAYKHLKYAANTDDRTLPENETLKTFTPVMAEHIWHDSRLIPTSGADLVTVLNMEDTQVFSTNAYGFNIPIVQRHINLPLAKVSPSTFFAPELINCVPDNLTPGYEYRCKIYENGQEIAYNSDDWYIDIGAGIVHFFMPCDFNNVTASFWQYIGRNGADLLNDYLSIEGGVMYGNISMGTHDFITNGIIRSTNSTPGTSEGTGAIILAGGMYVGGSTFFNSSISAGSISASTINASSFSINDTLVLDNMRNLTCNNLDVKGTMTIIDSQTINVADNTIVLNSGPTGTRDGGFMMQRWASDLITRDTPDETGILESATPDTITLPITSDPSENYYTGWIIKCGTQTRTIDAYVNHVAHITPDWDPIVSGAYELFSRSYAGIVYSEAEKGFRLEYCSIPSSIISSRGLVDLYCANISAQDINANSLTGSSAEINGLASCTSLAVNEQTNLYGSLSAQDVTASGVTIGAAFDANALFTLDSAFINDQIVNSRVNLTSANNSTRGWAIEDSIIQNYVGDVTSVSAMYLYPHIQPSALTNINLFAGLFLDSGQNDGLGSVTRACALYINAPSFGSENYSIYSNGVIYSSSYAGNWAGEIIDLAHGGTGASLTASLGGIVYSSANSLAVLANTATANQILLSGVNAPTWSTCTYPATIGANQLLYASSANVIAGLATINSSILTSNSSGVPTWSADISVNSISASTYTAPGDVQVNKNLCVQAGNALRLYNSANTFYSALKSGANTSNLTWTLPIADAAGFLYSNGAGTLTFTNYIATLSVDTITAPNNVQIDKNLCVQAGNALRLYNSANTFYSALNSGANTSNLTWTLPIADANGYLRSDGAGVLSFSNSWSGNVISLAYGGTGASLSANAGGVVYSTSSALAITSPAASIGQILLSGATSAPTWSACTFPSSITANKLLYTSADNVIAGLTTPITSVLTSSALGVPTWSTSVTLTSAQIGNFSISANTIAGTSGNENIIISPHGSGDVSLTASLNINAAHTLRFWDNNNSNYIAFTAPNSFASNTVWTLPSADGNGFFKSDGAGNMSIATAVTSISAGSNLTGGTITGTGTIALSSTPSGLTSIGVGNVNISANTISTSSGALILDPATVIQLNHATNIQSAGSFQYYNSTNTFYSAFKAGANTSNITWTLPIADSAGFLYSNGAGTLSFTNYIATLSVDTITASGDVQVNKNLSVQTGNALKFFESSNLFYAAFKAGSLTSSITWTLPISDAAGFLYSNGAGVLSLTNSIATLSVGTLTSSNALVLNPTNEVQSNKNINIQAANSLKFFNAANTFYSALKCGSNTSNITWTLPIADTAGYLRSDGSGALSFSNLIGVTNGGTGASLTLSAGGIVYSASSTLAVLANTATANQLLMSGASAPVWSTCTFPATVGANQLLYASSANVLAGLATANSAVLVTNSSGVPSWSTSLTLNSLNTANLSLSANTISSTTLNANIILTPNGSGEVQASNNLNIQSANSLKFFNAANTFYSALKCGTNSSNLTWTLPTTDATGYLRSDGAGNLSFSNSWTGAIIGTTYGGTGASLTLSAGGIVYSASSTLAVLANTATANQLLMSGASTPSWSACTFPSSTTANQLLYSSATNTVSGLTSANSAVLVTNSSGVPSWSTSLSSTVQGNITALGTISSGTWNGGIIGTAYGGTGLSSYALGDIIYCSASNVLSKLTGNITTNLQVLTQTGSGASSAAPVWASLSTTNVGEGTNLYFTTARVLSTALSTYSASAGTLSTADTVISAFNKLGANLTATANSIPAMNAAGSGLSATSAYYNGGNIVVGNATSVAINSATPLQVHSSGATFSGARYAANTSGSAFILGKSRASAIGAHTIIQNGDTLGEIIYTGSDGANFQVAGRLQFTCGSAPSTNIVPGAFRLYVTDSAGTEQQLMIANSASQFAFGSATVSSGAKFTFNGTYALASGTLSAHYISATAQATGNLAAINYAWVSPQFNIAASTTTTAAYGMLIDAGTTNLNTTGAITTGYGLYVANPSFGTTKYAGYFTGSLATTAQMYIGGIAPSIAAQLNVIVGSGVGSAFTLNGSVTTGATQYGFYANPTFTPASANGAAYMSAYLPTLSMISNTTTLVGRYLNLAITGAYTLTNAYGMYIDAGSSSATAVTNAYGLYVNNPGFGTTKYAAYFNGGLVYATNQLSVGNPTPDATVSFEAYSNANTAGYQNCAKFSVSNGVSAFSRLLVAQNSTNAMLLEAADQANNKGSLLLQPFGGKVGIGTTSPSWTLQIAGTSTLNRMFATSGGLSPTSNADANIYGSIFETSINPSIVAGGTFTSGAQVYVTPNFNLLANNIVTNAYGLYIDAGSAILGAGASVTNAYGLYVANPGFGTNVACARLNGTTMIGTTSLVSGGGILQISSGITFPATASTSSNVNTLDDYKEGSWTPSLGGGSFTYTSRTATFTKIGRKVSIFVQVGWSARTATGTLTITGLPYAVVSPRSGCVLGYTAGLPTATQIVVACDSGSTPTFYQMANVNVPTPLAVSSTASSGEIQLQCTYEAAT